METNYGKPKRRISAKNIFIIILLLACVGIYAWAYFKMGSIEKHYMRERGELVSAYTAKIDSLENQKIQLGVQMLGWAVRSEMNRGNTEQVDQFFNTFIKENKVIRIDLVDPATQKITQSTDKKMEEATLNSPSIMTADKQVTVPSGADWQIINPIMGLDKKLGILVVTVKK